jgi:hypothetical protein
MDSLLFFVSILTSIVFVAVPILLTVSIVYRYQQVERTAELYTGTLRALVAYLERGQRPEPMVKLTPPPAAPRDWWGALMRTFKPAPPPPTPAQGYNLADDFEDYLSVIRDGDSEGARYMRFKRKSLKMRQDVDQDVEYCRTYTEALPYLGILGTVLGFFFSPAVFQRSVAMAGPPTITVGGLILALASTAAALACIILIKLFYENAIMPKVLTFEQSLQVLDDYAGRYGGIAQTAARGTPTS